MLSYSPQEAIAHLRSVDPILARVINAVGPFRMELRAGIYRSLAWAIFFQQLAGPAARAILKRTLEVLATDMDRFFTPEEFLAADKERIRAAGLSRQKLTYLRDLSEKFMSQQLSEEEFANLEDEEVVQKVTVVKGIGRWTAEILLIFSLGRADVLPVDDLGMRRGFKQTYNLPDLPSPSEMKRIAQPWRPYRTVGTWYMWRSLGIELPE